MGNWETLIGTILGALIAGLSVFLNSVYSSKTLQKREHRNRIRDEKDKDISELEKLYQDILHLLDKLTRELGSLDKTEIERYYNLEIRLQLISTTKINQKVNIVRSKISEMASQLPTMPDEFIPKFEEDLDRRARLRNRKKAKKERKEKSEEFFPDIRKEYENLQKLMKEDLENRKLLDVENYLEYRKKN